MGNNYTAALDFGSGKISLAVGCRTDNGVKIVSYHDTPSTGIKNGEIINDYQVEQSVRELISRANYDINDEIEDVIVGVGAKLLHSFSENLSKQRAIPNEYITETEISELTKLRFNARNDEHESVFEAVPQNYSIDDYIGLSGKEIIGMSGKQIDTEFLLVFGKDALMDHRRTILDKCGLTIRKAILNPVASARAVLSEQEMENGAVLVDIGKGTTEVAIVKDNIIREIATIPFAGESVTTDIKSVANVTGKWAEEMKVKKGCCCEEFIPENTRLILKGPDGSTEGETDLTLLTRVIEARMSEILEAVRYIIDRNKYSESLASGVVITGGSCYLENIKQLAQAILGKKVRIAAPRGCVTADSHEAAFDAYSSTAVGLVLEGISPMLSHAPAFAQKVKKPLFSPTDNTEKEPVKKKSNGLFGGFFGSNEPEDEELAAKKEALRKEQEEAERQRKELEKKHKEEEKQRKEEEKQRKEEEKRRKEEERRRREEEKRNQPSLFDKIFSDNNDKA